MENHNVPKLFADRLEASRKRSAHVCIEDAVLALALAQATQTSVPDIAGLLESTREDTELSILNLRLWRKAAQDTPANAASVADQHSSFKNPIVLGAFEAMVGGGTPSPDKARTRREYGWLIDDYIKFCEQFGIDRSALSSAIDDAKSSPDRGKLKTLAELLRDSQELADLRQQLEQERAKREAAEAEAAKLARQLTDCQQGQQPGHQHEASATGLTFPYATRELKAMHAAALKYWADHTRDKRQPTQKEIGYELCELLGLERQANNDPARKATILAVAIKPDALPDA